MRAAWLALLAALAVFLPASARADERILHFLSDVTVAQDGTLHVVETIRLRSEGEAIQRGILRDFPTRYEGRHGRQVTVGFEVEEVLRDGQPETWSTEPLSNGVQVRIGRAEVLLPPGEHIYAIRYRTTRQIRFFEGYDELYWNATGNEWTFPIDAAEARIRLPRAAAFGDRAFYTGPQGATAAYARVFEEKPGEIAFRTTAPLDRKEGLTVAVAWPKGIVRAPSEAEQAEWWLRDNGPLAVGLLGLLGVLSYYFHAWRKAGRGPRPGTIVPIFSPPDGLSPAAIRYVSEMGADTRTLAAAIVDLGVRGRLRLVEGEKGVFSRAKTTIEKAGSSEGLPAPEMAMMNKLFGGGDSILMDDKYHATFSGAREALGKGLATEHDGSLFVRNWSWSLRGLFLTLAAMWLAAATVLAAGGDGPWVALSGIAMMGVALMLYRWSSPADDAVRIAGKIGALVVGIVAAGVGVATIGQALNSGRVLAMLVPLIALPVVISAFWWMAAPTRKGRAVMDRIAGFKQYLSITEEERLQTMHPPEKTPELFERYLPYAIALEVENRWAARFESVLAAAATAGQAQTMSWYSGHSDPWNDVDGFADRMGSSLTRAVSSASTAPGSSSGSSGGGSSGGGGGGGGGSGW